MLDTNEFIGALGVVKNPASEFLFSALLKAFPKHTLHIPRMIIDELRRNLPPIIFTEVIKTIQFLTIIDENIVVPFEIGFKYESLSLKPADAFIAAYTEWIKAEILVTENRHFLTRHEDLPFKVLNAESCLKILSK